MKLLARITGVIAGTALLLTGCHGGGSTPSVGQNVVQPYTGPEALASFTWGASYLNQSTYMGPATFGSMTVDVMVNMRDEAGLVQYAQEVSNPASPLYRKFLTPEQIGSQFGASQSDYATVAAYFQSYGLSVGEWPQHEIMAVAGTQANLQAAFGTTFGQWQRAGQLFIAPNSAPHFSRVIPVSGVTNLVAAQVAHTYLIRGSAADFAGFSPQQIARGFDYSGAYSSGYNGSGIVLGIIGTGGITQTDLTNFGNIFHTTMAPITIVAAQPQAASSQNGGTGTGAFDPHPGGLATPPPVTDPNCNGSSAAPTANCNPEDGEAQLDTEQQASLAPGATIKFYLAYNPADTAYCPVGPPCSGLQGIELTDDEIQQAIADNVADSISASFGEGENEAEAAGYFNSSGQGVGPAEFAALAAEGIAVFISSGDTGAEECANPSTGAHLAIPCVSYPAGDPSVVSVGGVNAPFDNTGALQPGAQIIAWGDNTTGGGNGSFENNVGSGGGVSLYFAAPSWQLGITGSTMRAQPDMALMGDPATSGAMLMNSAFAHGYFFGPVGGTSESAPEAAAQWALVLQACKATPSCAIAGGAHPYRLGNPGPLLYAIYSGKATGSFTPHLPYANVFYDVLAGSNQAVPPNPAPSATPITGCCHAGPGYDEVTGLGVPYGGHLIQAITGATAP